MRIIEGIFLSYFNLKGDETRSNAIKSVQLSRNKANKSLRLYSLSKYAALNLFILTTLLALIKNYVRVGDDIFANSAHNMVDEGDEGTATQLYRLSENLVPAHPEAIRRDKKKWEEVRNHFEQVSLLREQILMIRKLHTHLSTREINRNSDSDPSQNDESHDNKIVSGKSSKV